MNREGKEKSKTGQGGKPHIARWKLHGERAMSLPELRLPTSPTSAPSPSMFSCFQPINLCPDAEKVLNAAQVLG